MKIVDKYKNKRPVLSFEIFPPKRNKDLESIDETLSILAQLNPDYISVTFGAGGSLNNNSTISLAKKIKNEYNIEPLVHLTCCKYKKEDIDQILEELDKNGIRNILALRGDNASEYQESCDFNYASDLVKYINSKDLGFNIAGACYPEKHPESPSVVSDIKSLKEKVDSGTVFLITQLFFENEIFYNFIEKCNIAGINVPVSAGVMPVINKAQIERIITLCGASLSDKFKKILVKYDDNKNGLFDAGITYALNQVVDLIASGVDGIHIYTMNNPVVAQRICDGIKNII